MRIVTIVFLAALLLCPVSSYAGLADFAIISLTGSLTAGQNFNVTTSPGNVGALGNILIGNSGAIAGGAVARDDSPASTISLGTSVVSGQCVTAGGSVTGTCTGGNDTDGVNALITSFDNAVAEAAILGASLDALTPTDTLAAITNTATISSSNTGLVVFDIPSITLGSNETLTLSGASTDTFVIDTGSITLGQNSDIALTGGLLASQVIFHLSTTSISVNSSDLFGTFYIGEAGCSISNSFTLDGALICRDDISFDENTTINSNPFAGELPVPIPEPATSLLLGAGLAGLIVLRRRRAGKTC